jgi:hypothetical protein
MSLGFFLWARGKSTFGAECSHFYDCTYIYTELKWNVKPEPKFVFFLKDIIYAWQKYLWVGKKAKKTGRKSVFFRKLSIQALNIFSKF